MAWCPKCKNEYIDGVTKCSDCGADLVDSLEDDNISTNASDMNTDNEIFDSTQNNDVSNDSSDSNAAMEENVFVNEEGHSSSSPTYTKLSDKYEDVKSSAYTLLFVGAVGFIAILLEAFGVFNIPIAHQTKWLFYTVMGGIFIAFIISGIISFMHAKQLKIDAESEDKLIDEILSWFRANYTKENIDSQIDTDVQEELLYFNRAEYIKNEIMHQFESADEPLVDSLIEIIYTEFFE